MKRIVSSFLFVLGFAFLPTCLSAQSTRETGRELLRGEFNFAALADSYARHLPLPIEKEIENDEEQPHLLRPAITDPALVHGWAPPTTYGVTHFADSPAPTDTFESTLDNNTGIPPDTHGAVDSNYCMTTINTDVRIQNRAGTVISTVSLDAFFTSVLPGGGTFDPRCHYDIATHRWIVVADAGAQSSSSCLLIAISKTSNPTGAWWTYLVTAYPAGDYWLDFPDVGFNNKWVTISGNLFANSGSGYNGCKVFAFNKASLLSGAGAPFTAFTEAGSECICPAITYDPVQTSQFCVENYDGSAAGGGQLHLWKITGAVGSEVISSVGFPASTGVNWQDQSNQISGTGGADFAPQVGTANLIQTNDDRIAQVVMMNNKLWCSHNIFLPYSTTANATRCSVQWWQMDTLASPIQVGMVDDATSTNFYVFPCISVNTSDDALMGFSTFSSGIHPSAAYAMHLHTDAAGSMEALDVFRHGTNTYYKTGTGTRDRWGDYSGCCIDPLNQTDFWTIQEASANPANTFDTWWAYVKPCNPPGATITPGGPLSFCSGSSVTLTANSGTGYTYQWYASSTAIPGATNISYTANASGSYTVSVNVVTCTSGSTGTTVTVNPIPVATITPTGSTTICTGGSVTLNATPGAGYTYQWLSGTSLIAGATTASYTALTGGSYKVIITNAGGCFDTSAATPVIIGLSPTATITPSGPTTFCSGGSVVLTASAGAGYTYQWNSGGGPLAGATNATYTASAGGNYTVLVTNASGCSATSAITSVVVNPTPAAISATGSPVFCAGTTLSLSDGTAGGTWASSNTAVATVSGTGLVTGIGSGGMATISYTLSGCSAVYSVTVNSTSLAAITGAAAVCIGQSIPLSDITPSGSWTSSSPGTASVGATTGLVSGVASGTATISYVVSGTCGAATVTKLVTVSAPTAVAGISGILSLCAGATTPLSDATPSGVWSASNAAVTTISASGLVTAVGTGVDTITYSVTNASGCVSSAITPFTVFSSFVATITPSGSTTFCTGGSVLLNATTGSGMTYQWYKSGTLIAGAVSSSYTATTTGNYTVKISEGGCNSTSVPVVVTVNPLPIVTPSVSLSATAGPVFCMTTTSSVFTAVPVNGGTAPTYQWYVNGVAVGTGASYTFAAPHAADVIKCVLTSNATCAFPTSASHSDTISLSPVDTPAVTISESPALICFGSTAIFTAAPVWGGTSPSYLWTKNTVNVAVGPSYSYSPVNGDVLKVTMISNYPCTNNDTAVSVALTVHTQTPVPNTVTIMVTQSGIVSGSVDTFIAIAPNGGSAPTYQWLRNGLVIPGATNAIYVTDSLAAGQVISCRETSSEECATPATAISGGLTVRIIPSGISKIVSGNDQFVVVPNPNKGNFTVQGFVSDLAIDHLSLVVVDMLGRIVYHDDASIKNGVLDTQVNLSSSISNGTYLLTITCGADNVVYHVVVSR